MSPEEQKRQTARAYQGSKDSLCTSECPQVTPSEAPRTAPSFRGPRLCREKNVLFQPKWLFQKFKYQIRPQTYTHIHTFLPLRSVLRTEYPWNQGENSGGPTSDFLGLPQGPGSHLEDLFGDPEDRKRQPRTESHP